MHYLFVFLLVWSSVVFGETAWAETLWTDAQMRSAMELFHGKLELTAGQQRIFFEEVLPQSRKFIQPDLATPASGVGPAPSPVVNTEKVKSYLQFYVSPGAVSAPKIMLYLEPSEDCASCKTREHLVRNLTYARMERRGFLPLWLSLHEFPRAAAQSVAPDSVGVAVPAIGSQPSGEVKPFRDVEMDDDPESPAKTQTLAASLGSASMLVPPPVVSVLSPEMQAAHQARMAQLEQWMAKKDAAAYLWVHWSTTHMEVHYFSPEGKLFSRQKPLEEKDRLESVEADLLNDLYGDIALDLASQRSPASAKSTIPEQAVCIRLTRVTDFAELARIKTAIATEVKDFVGLKEKSITRGEHVFAVLAKSTPELMRTQLESVKLRLHNELGPARNLQFTILETHL